MAAIIMTRAIAVIQLGVGRVGAAVAALIEQQAARWHASDTLALALHTLADSSAHLRLTPDFTLADALALRAAATPFATHPGVIPAAEWSAVLAQALTAVAAPADVVVVDCATGNGTTPLLRAARRAGVRIVLANKDPLAGPLDDFQALVRRAPGEAPGNVAGISATVGAGLPVLRTLATSVASGDQLLSVAARASGSLGFLCDRLSSGERFDTALRAAVEQGYTEPDPRQDLSGFDVARKLLILARTAGHGAELDAVQVESLVPLGTETLPVADFLETLSAHAQHLGERVAQARAAGNVVHYIGACDANGRLSASLQALAPDAALARGSGPENVFVLRTTRYDAHPLTISGPGAGIAVTSGAVMGDVLAVLGVVA